MGKSFCTISSFVDCDVPLMSEYSKIGRMLTSEVGVLYYFFFLVMGLTSLIATQSRRAIHSFLLFPALGALLYTAYFAYISFFILHALCIFCLVTYIANIGIFIMILTGLKLNPLKMPRLMIDYIKNDRSHLLRYGIVMIVVAAVGVFFFKGLNKEIHAKRPVFNKSLFLKHFYEQPVVTIDLEDQPTKGSATAPIHIVDFSDFQCPHCRRAAFSLLPYLGTYRKDVKITYVHYPLDMKCNPNIERLFHEQACLAAKASLCADQKGKFWPYHDLVFENQLKLSRKTFIKLAKQIGLDEEVFSQCLASDAVAQKISRDIALAQKVGIGGTPAIYVNGRLVSRWTYPEVLPAVMEAELMRLSQSAP
jgi:protein-disulfide isomerase/uncharacterized membrane protein